MAFAIMLSKKTENALFSGLRTLELCVDNLQPEYLYEHMAPVRAPLMQGLWSMVGGPILDSEY